MHKLSAVVEILVQILERAPLWNFRSEIPPPPRKNEKLHIWVDQSLYHRVPQMKNFRFELNKVQTREPPTENENLTFLDNLQRIGPEKHQIWVYQSADQRAPPPPRKLKLSIFGQLAKMSRVSPHSRKWKTSDLSWPKFRPESPSPTPKIKT